MKYWPVLINCIHLNFTIIAGQSFDSVMNPMES